jgi:hypothetical protein
MGGREEIARETINQSKDKIGRHVPDQIKKMIRDSGFDVD